jgi:hypothetical protein
MPYSSTVQYLLYSSSLTGFENQDIQESAGVGTVVGQFQDSTGYSAFDNRYPLGGRNLPLYLWSRLATSH